MTSMVFFDLPFDDLKLQSKSVAPSSFDFFEFFDFFDNKPFEVESSRLRFFVGFFS